MGQGKKIIIFLIFIFIVGSSYLFFVSERYQDPEYNKNWWVVYFEDMQGSGMDFVLENHSGQTDFHWDVSVNKEKIQEGNLQIPRGQRQVVSLDAFQEKEKITITVSAGDEKKEIYKYLNR